MSVYERKTTALTEVCITCSYVFTEDDDYDTLGAEKALCCPDCGREDFITVETIIKQRDALLAACEDIRSPDDIAEYERWAVGMISKPNLRVYRNQFNKLLGFLRGLRHQSEKAKAAIKQCE